MQRSSPKAKYKKLQPKLLPRENINKNIPFVKQANQIICQAQDSQTEQAQYIQYLYTLPISDLQKELMSIKNHQKTFYRLNEQFTVLERKSRQLEEIQRDYEIQSMKTIDKQGRKLDTSDKKVLLTEADWQDEQINKLKAQIQDITSQTKRLVDETKVIKAQSVKSREDLAYVQDKLNRIKQQNRTAQQKIQKDKQTLIQKKKITQVLSKRQLEEKQAIQEIRKQIKQLQRQLALLVKQLKMLEQQRELKQAKKKRMNELVYELQENIIKQQQNQHQLQEKLMNCQHVKRELEEELVKLRQTETNLSQQAERLLQEYHKKVETVKESERQILNLQDQLFIVEGHTKELNQHFIHEAELLKQQQQENAKINSEFDRLTNEAIQIWNSITQLIEIQTQNQSQKYNTKQKPKFNSQIYLKKFKSQNDNKKTQQQNQQHGQEESMSYSSSQNQNISNNNQQTESLKLQALKIWKQIQSLTRIKDKHS